jgi:hypothetical protein
MAARGTWHGRLGARAAGCWWPVPSVAPVVLARWPPATGCPGPPCPASPAATITRATSEARAPASGYQLRGAAESASRRQRKSARTTLKITLKRELLLPIFERECGNAGVLKGLYQRKATFWVFEMLEAGVLVTLAVMSPEPGGDGGDGEAVAMLRTEARPGWGDVSNTARVLRYGRGRNARLERQESNSVPVQETPSPLTFTHQPVNVHQRPGSTTHFSGLNDPSRLSDLPTPSWDDAASNTAGSPPQSSIDMGEKAGVNVHPRPRSCHAQ